MTNHRRAITGLAFLLLLTAFGARASGPVGIYGVIEKVVFEPNAQTPERALIWGAFAFTDQNNGQVTDVKRGYLYFKLPPGSEKDAANARTEWKDLQAQAGTGQAVAFGSWGYIGGLEGLSSDARTPKSGPPYTLSPEAGHPLTDVRVRKASEAAGDPAVYVIGTGMVKLSAQGNHAEIVRKLRAAIQQ